VRREPGYRGLFEPDEYARVGEFYRAHPDLEPAPLVRLPGLAADLGLGGLLVKDESGRFGVDAFKITGARYAMASLGPERLRAGVVCATAGNHGRAVARAARDLGIACTVFLPAADPGASAIELRTRRARVAAMQADGAATLDVDGTYEGAISRAAGYASETGAAVVSDASWPGYEEIPRLVMLGYTHIFEEASRQWDRAPDVVLIQGGVGGLVCAAANWFAMRFGAARPFLIACEPESAACLLASARAGRLVSITDATPGGRRAEPADAPRRPAIGSRPADGNTPPPTIMAGLRCAVPSPAAWPSIHAGVDAFIAIPDAFAVEAMERLARPARRDPAVAAGPSGACGVGTLLALARSPDLAAIGEACRFDRSIRAMAVVTESP